MIHFDDGREEKEVECDQKKDLRSRADDERQVTIAWEEVRLEEGSLQVSLLL